MCLVQSVVSSPLGLFASCALVTENSLDMEFEVRLFPCSVLSDVSLETF